MTPLRNLQRDYRVHYTREQTVVDLTTHKLSTRIDWDSKCITAVDAIAAAKELLRGFTAVNGYNVNTGNLLMQVDVIATGERVQLKRVDGHWTLV